ncbi:hypothetical protein ACU4GR_15680 [Methylobacterium oryzae CBMB20]
MPSPKILLRLVPRRPAPWLAAGFALALLWALGASYVVVFHDDVLAGFVARQGAMRDAYEARLAELRDLLDRDRHDRAGSEAGLADRVSAALERQAELERRAAALAGLERQSLTDPITTGALASRPDAGLDEAGDGLLLRPSDAAASTRSAIRPLPAGARATPRPG